jgi:hypothetical protein
MSEEPVKIYALNGKDQIDILSGRAQLIGTLDQLTKNSSDALNLVGYWDGEVVDELFNIKRSLRRIQSILSDAKPFEMKTAEGRAK